MGYEGSWSGMRKYLEKEIHKNVRARLESVPTTTIISVSQNDADQCRCANCLEWDAYYGSPSGTILAFVNEVAKEIAKKSAVNLGLPLNQPLSMVTEQPS